MTKTAMVTNVVELISAECGELVSILLKPDAVLHEGRTSTFYLLSEETNPAFDRWESGHKHTSVSHDNEKTLYLVSSWNKKEEGPINPSSSNGVHIPYDCVEKYICHGTLDGK